MNEIAKVTCERVVEEMASVLDGSAPAELLDHVAGCDACRDARYDAERAELLMSEAGSDFEVPEAFVKRLPPPVPAATAPPPALEPAAAPAPAPTHNSQLTTHNSQLTTHNSLKALAKRWAVPLLAAAAAAPILIGRAKESGTSADDPELTGEPWRGKVGKVATRDGKLEICAPNGSSCHDAREGDDVPAGSQLRTDRSTLCELSFTDGSSLSLDRETTLRLSTRGRGGELVKGGLVADVEHHENWSARFAFKGGHVDVLGTKFSLRSDDDSAVVHVARGEVRLSDGAGHDTLVQAGEEGRVYPGSPPVTSAGAGLGEALGWSEAVQAEPD